MKSGRPWKVWDERPRLRADLRWVYEAFWEIQTCRPVGMAMAPIPWTAIRDWANENEVVGKERFQALIRRLDQAALRVYRRRRDGTNDDEE